MIELFQKLVDNFSNKDFKDGMLTAIIIILLVLSSSSLIGNEVVFNWGYGKYQGDFDWLANTNQTEEIFNDLGSIKSSDGETESMYKVYVQEFDSSCIYKLKIVKHDGKTYDGTYCLKGDNTIENLEKYSVTILDINQGLEKPIKVKVYRKVVIKWYWLLIFSALLFIYLMTKINKSVKKSKTTKKSKGKKE